MLSKGGPWVRLFRFDQFGAFVSKSDKFKYYLQYAFLRVYLGFMRLFPYKLRINVGGFLLGSILKVLPDPKRRIQKNLSNIYPDLSEQDRENMRGEISTNLGRTFTEIFNASSYDAFPELIHVSGDGLEVVKNQIASGKGAILVSGHFGQWNAPRHYLKAIGADVGMIYRPSNNPYFDRILVSNMAVSGSAIFGKGSGMIDMIRHVRGGGIVAVLIDQKFRGGKQLKFMGHKASTSIGAAEIALKYGIPLIPAYAIKRDKGLEVDVVFEAPIPHTDAVKMTQAANDSLTARVRANPEQWYWLHQRWNFKKKK